MNCMKALFREKIEHAAHCTIFLAKDPKFNQSEASSETTLNLKVKQRFLTFDWLQLKFGTLIQKRLTTLGLISNDDIKISKSSLNFRKSFSLCTLRHSKLADSIRLNKVKMILELLNASHIHDIDNPFA